MEGKSVHSSAGKSKETKNSEDKGDVDTEENEAKEATEIIEHDKNVSNVSPNDKPNNKETSIDENKDEDIAVISKNVESTKENITDSKSETLHESESIISQPLESQSIQQQTETEPQTGSGWGLGGIGNLLSTSVAAVERTLGVRRPQEMIRDDITVIITNTEKNVESTKENITDSESETPHESESITSQPLESQSIQQQTETEPQTGSSWGWGGIGAISKGIRSVVTNVESTLGVRQPQEMIRDDITVIITNTEKNVESTKDNITDSESETPHESESITSQPLESQSIQQQTETEPQTGSSWGWGGIGAISKGIRSVVTNVEITLGVPQPQEMIRYQEVEEDFKKKEEKDDQHG